MADFGGFSVQTPQEILAALDQQRRAVRLQGTVGQNRQANMQTALDALFGNPQLNLAKRQQARIQQAEAGVTPVAGESDLSREIRRLAAIRDAIGSESPEVASQITTQLLKLEQARMEQQKLQSDEQRAAAAEQRAADMHPFNVARGEIEAMQGLNEGVNYWRRGQGGGIERVNVDAMDSLERRRLRTEGWVEGSGPTTEAEAGDALGLTKPTTNDLQTALLEADAQLDGLVNIMQKYDPKFTTIANQVKQWGTGWYERMTGDIPASEAAEFQQYSEWRRNSVDAFNRYIKFITGAAMSVKEAERIQKAFPDASTDSHTRYVGKLREVARQTMAVRKRAQQALVRGLEVSGDGWDKIQLPTVSDAEVDAFMAQMGLGPQVEQPRQNPPAAPQGVGVTNW